MDIQTIKTEIQENFDNINETIEERKKLIINIQDQITELTVEAYRLQGEYRLIEKLENKQEIALEEIKTKK